MSSENSLSLPVALDLIMDADEKTIVVANIKSGEVFSFSERYLNIADNFGEISAYVSYSPEQLDIIRSCCDYISSPDDFLRLPPKDFFDEKAMIEKFLEKQPEEISVQLEKSLRGFGNKLKKFEKALKALSLSDSWENFANDYAISSLEAFCEKNNISTTREKAEKETTVLSQEDFAAWGEINDEEEENTEENE